MSSESQLLHIALYSRGSVKDSEGNPAYHWAFNLSSSKNDLPSIQNSIKHDATNATIPETGESPWRTRTVAVKEDVGQLLLSRITIVELKDYKAFIDAIGTVPVPQDDPRFNCGTWVRDATKVAGAQGCFRGERRVDWSIIGEKVASYMAEKRATGRWESDEGWDARVPATWSLIEDKEVMP